MTEKSNPPRSILAEAADVVAERGKRYGSPMANHNRTAQLWGAYLGVELTAADVCKLNILQKLSRDRHQANRDNLVDVAGYVENALLAEPGTYDPVKEQGFHAFGVPKTTSNDVTAAPFDDVRQQIRGSIDTLGALTNERAAHDATTRALERERAALANTLVELQVAREDAEAQRRKADDLAIANQQLKNFIKVKAQCGPPLTPAPHDPN